MPTRVVAIGDNCLDWYLDRERISPGGNALNVAVFCRRLGARVAYIGQFGTDRTGDLMISALTAEDVDISRVRRKPGTSGYAIIENVAGDRVFRGVSDGVVRFQPEEADFAFMAGADLIHTGDSSYLEEHIERLAGLAPVSFDFSTAPADYCARLLPAVSYATFSRAGMGDAAAIDLITRAHLLGAREVYVTRGAQGSIVSDGSQIHRQPAHRVAEVVDTLGAGDSFIAAILMARLDGVPLPQAAALASERAAAACEVVGAFGHSEPSAGMVRAADHRDAPLPTENRKEQP